MGQNQNDQRSQQSDSKSKQGTTQDVNKRENDPNNPTANQGKQQGNQQQRDSNTTKPGHTTDVEELDEQDEETTGTVNGKENTGKTDADERTTANRDQQKSNL